MVAALGGIVGSFAAGFFDILENYLAFLNNFDYILTRSDRQKL